MLPFAPLASALDTTSTVQLMLLRLDALLEEAMREALQRKRRALEAELERQMTAEEARMRAVHARLA